MTGMRFKYRFTPFHLVALFFLGYGIYTLYSDLKIDYELGLGGLLPYVLISFSLGTLLVDVIIQLVISYAIKTHTHQTIYLTEFIIVAIGLLCYWKAFYPTIIRQ